MSESDLSGTVLDGRYKVIAPIAEGAMGAVYRGERLKLGKAVAIKIMHDALPDELASRQRFEREAKLMARLEHPHCVSVIDFGIYEDKPFLVMDLVRGTSVIEMLEKSGPVEIDRAADIVRQVLSGLGHAHELGIVHRDIKPANIMVTKKTGMGEQVMILDFGLARPATESAKLTAGIVVGTPNYMAPEQIKGGQIDARTDLYACGVMLFELITGKKPFLAEDPLVVVRKHLNEPPPKLATVAPTLDIGPELEEIVARALAKDPAHRFDSAAQMATAIEKAVDRRSARLLSQLMASAVPHSSAGPPGPQVATPSGWSVPHARDGSAPVGIVPNPAVPNPAVPNPAVPNPAVPNPAVPNSAMPYASGPNSAVPNPAGPYASGPNSAIPNSAVPYASGPNSAVPNPAGRYASGPNSAVPNSAGHVSSAPIAAPPADSSQAATQVAIAAATARPQTFGSAVTHVSRWISRLPLTRKHWMMVGGACVLLIIVIAATRGGGGAKDIASAAPAVPTARDAAPGDPMAPTLAHASDLYSNGELDTALDVVLKARREHPDNAQLAFLGGKIYFAKLWWTDGIKNFRDAIRLDPAYRNDPELIKIALRGFNTTPDTDSRLAEFLHDDIGAAAKPLLEQTAHSHPNATVRARAAAELRRFQ